MQVSGLRAKEASPFLRPTLQHIGKLYKGAFWIFWEF